MAIIEPEIYTNDMKINYRLNSGVAGKEIKLSAFLFTKVNATAET